ncbi:MAG: hypothetical protein ACJ8GK_04665 [Luteimonas sp.]
MKRTLLVPTLVAAAMLAGCATGYQYRGGNGDYYYGQPTVEYHDYGYGGFYGYPGGWGGSLGFGYGYGGWGYGYPYWGGYGYPYWGYGGYHGYYPHGGHHHHHHGGHDDSDSDDPVVPPSSPSPPPGAGVRPPSRALLPGPRTRTPILMRDPSLPMLSAPMPSRPMTAPVVTPRVDRSIQVAPPEPSAVSPRFQPSLPVGADRDGRRRPES